MLGYVIVLLAEGRLKRVCRCDTVSLHAWSDLPAERRSLPEPLYLDTSSELTCLPDSNPAKIQHSIPFKPTKTHRKQIKKIRQRISSAIVLPASCKSFSHHRYTTTSHFDHTLFLNSSIHLLFFLALDSGALGERKLILIGRTN